jgi:hypothetical protein
MTAVSLKMTGPLQSIWAQSQIMWVRNRDNLGPPYTYRFHFCPSEQASTGLRHKVAGALLCMTDAFIV